MVAATTQSAMLVLRNAAGALAVIVPLRATALECPPMPQQTQRDWDVAVALAVGRVDAASGPQLQAQTRTATTDLLKRLPNADRVYLEQMMYSTYCSTLRDNGSLTETERNARIQAYNRELRATLAAASRPAASTPDPRDAARAELERLPLPYSTDAFIETARVGKLPYLRLFLQAGIDANATDRRGATALMFASERGDLPMMDALLKARAKADMQMPSARGDGSTALNWAAGAGQVEAMRVLLKAGASKAMLDKALLSTLRGGHVEAARLLLHSGADPRADEGETGRWLALSAVSVSDSLPALLDLLLQRGWNVDARQRDGQTVLTQAAKNDHAELVRLLLKAGADVNQRCECSGIYGGNHTPLTLATVSSDSSDSGERTMQLLLDAGARVDDASADGTPLVQAARRGSLPRVRLLLTRGADPRRARDADGDTALMHAVKAARDGEMLQALMAAGADANAPGGGGATALMWAAAFDYGQVAALLLDAGARIEQASQIGRTALMMAAMSGSVEAARLLVLRGARTDPVDRDGRSALALAESRLNGDALLRMRSVLTQPKELR